MTNTPKWLKPDEVTEPGLYVVITLWNKKRSFLHESTTEHNVGKMFTRWRFFGMFTGCRFFGPIPEYKE